MRMRELKISKTITNRDAHSVEKYLQEIGKIDLLTPEEEIKLAERVKQNDQQAIDTLVKANLRFVVSVAKQYQGQGFSLSDLINEGNYGVIKAALRFDETKGFKFISYAVWWIRQSILQALTEQAQLVRLPQNKHGLSRKMTRATVAFEQQFERDPTPEELADILETPKHDIQNVFRTIGKHVSLDKPFGDGEGDGTMLDVIANPGADSPDKECIQESLLREIQASLGVLTERQREVIELFFGLDGKVSKTLDDIGEKYHLTRERARQIKDKALEKMRKAKNSNNLKVFLG